MPPGPPHADPASEPGDPVPSPDWMTAADWEAWCDATAVDDEPPAPGDDEDEPDAAPGELVNGTSGFAEGNLLDAMPGGGTLAFFAEGAAGDDGRYAGASDDELNGVISAWDRVEAYACARKHAAVAEFVRRRTEPSCAVDAMSGMPAVWDEFAVDELRLVLAESRGAAEDLMSRAYDLAVKLPDTMALFLAGRLRESRVKIIAYATAPLDPAEARAAEKLVLGRAGRLTPGGLRDAIARAVMDVAPDKARKRREAAARDARVQRWAEDSGNAALMGRELPPAEVLAADQRISAWAHELRQAGLDGSMDELRARAYLDLLLGNDSRPRPAQDSRPAASGDGANSDDGSGTGGPEGSSGADGPQGGGPGGPRLPGPGGPGAGVVPAGFAVRGTLTVPLVTLAGLADRPGELGGIGPIDPWLARNLAEAAARNPKTTWCVTVTDEQGHAVGHGCARAAPRGGAKRKKPEPPGGARDGPEFSFIAEGREGSPGGYGTWRLRTPGDGPDLIIELYPVTTEHCDHRFQAKGHDPGVRLRHLAQVRHATCTSPVCRRPAATCDFEHNVPYETGGRTCLCNAGPKCRHDHRLKQQPRWKVQQLPDGTFRWTTPSGRSYTTEPTRYPI
jgi:Domain of unknown function (DUF222)